MAQHTPVAAVPAEQPWVGHLAGLHVPRLRDLEEKTFIRNTLGRFASTAAANGIDDCIVIDPSELFGRDGLPYIVYSIDHPSKIRRRLPDHLEWRFYGRWVAACTAGDVLAMGAQPKGFSLDLAAPLDTDTATIEEIYAGIVDVLEAYGATFEGGNVDANAALELVAVCWGTCGRDNLIRRVGARPGDYVAVTGDLGVGWASFLIDDRGLTTSLDATTADALLNYNVLPLAPHAAILEAARSGGITSGMDLTDGVIEFLYTIAERNGLGAVIEEERLGVLPILRECASLLRVTPAAIALEPGYDTPRIHGYTIRADRWDDVQRCFAGNGGTIQRIGHVEESGGVVLRRANGRERLVPRFWDDQFSKESLATRWTSLIVPLVD